MNKTLAALFAAFALAFASNAYAAAAPSKPIVLPAKKPAKGPVTFEHSKHAKVKCTQCHKDEKGGDIEGFGKTVNQKTAHALCLDCHKKSEDDKAPKKCDGCHKA